MTAPVLCPICGQPVGRNYRCAGFDRVNGWLTLVVCYPECWPRRAELKRIIGPQVQVVEDPEPTPPAAPVPIQEALWTV